MNFNKKATLPWFIYTFFLILSFDISFILVLCSLNMIYLGLSCIAFSKIPGLVACFLSLFLENSYSLLQIFCTRYVYVEASLVAQTVKNLSAMQENLVWSLGQEDPLQKGMATHASTLVWRIPWTEELGGLQSMRSLRVDMTEGLTLLLTFKV